MAPKSDPAKAAQQRQVKKAVAKNPTRSALIKRRGGSTRRSGGIPGD